VIPPVRDHSQEIIGLADRLAPVAVPVTEPNR
jgi:hypothetical protein